MQRRIENRNARVATGAAVQRRTLSPFYLSWKAKQFDFRTRFIELAGEINGRMPYYVVDETAAALNEPRKPLKGSRVLVLGLAYKRDIDDLRESPALTIIELLQQRGAAVDCNDPFFPTVAAGGTTTCTCAARRWMTWAATTAC